MEKITNNKLAATAIASLAESFGTSTSSRAVSGTSFQNFLNNAGASNSSGSAADKNVSDVSRKKSDIYSKDNVKNDEVYEDESNVSDKNEIYKKADANENVLDEKVRGILNEDVAEDVVNEDVLNENIADTTEDVKAVTDGETVLTEKADEINEKEAEIVKVTAEATGLSEEDVENILSEMGISALQLADKDTLTQFMEKAFDVNSPIELISVDGAKEMIETISNSAETALEELTSDAPELINEIFENSVSEKVTEKAEERFDKMIGNDEDTVIVQTERDTVQFTSVNETQMQQSSGFQMFQNGNGAFSGNQQSGESNSFQNFNVSGSVMENISNALNEVVSEKDSVTGHVNSAEIIRQIIEKIEIQSSEQQINEMKITLKPDYLGEVSLKIASHNGIVTAHFTAESQRVKEIIQSNFDALKESLSQQGIEVGQLEVNVGNSNENPSQFAGAQYTGGSERTDNSIGGSVSDTDTSENVGYIDNDEVIEANVSYMA